MLPMEFIGVAKSERHKRARALLDQVELTGGTQSRKPSHLSGGEQQRVAIARALANQPKLILADEPAGNLDSQTADTIVELLRTLAHSHDTTVVVVTHDETIAEQSDRTLRLADGHLDEDESRPNDARTCFAPARRILTSTISSLSCAGCRESPRSGCLLPGPLGCVCCAPARAGRCRGYKAARARVAARLDGCVVLGSSCCPGSASEVRCYADARTGIAGAALEGAAPVGLGQRAVLESVCGGNHRSGSLVDRVDDLGVVDAA